MEERKCLCDCFCALKQNCTTKKIRRKQYLKALKFKLEYYSKLLLNTIRNANANIKLKFFFSIWKKYQIRINFIREKKLAFFSLKVKNKILVLLRERKNKRKLDSKRLKEFANKNILVRRYFIKFKKQYKDSVNFKYHNGLALHFLRLRYFYKFRQSILMYRRLTAKKQKATQHYYKQALKQVLHQWLSNSRRFKQQRLLLTQKRRCFKGWKRLAELHKIQEDKKARFFRTLLLKKYGFHLWILKKNASLLLKFANHCFLSHICHRWRSYIYRKRIYNDKLLQAKTKFGSLLAIRRKTMFIARLYKFSARNNIRKEYLEKADDFYIEWMVRRNNYLKKQSLQSLRCNIKMKKVERMRRTNSLRFMFNLLKLHFMHQKVTRLQQQIETKKINNARKKIVFSKFRALLRIHEFKQKLAKGFLKMKSLHKIFNSWASLTKAQIKKRIHACVKFAVRKLLRKGFSSLYIYLCKRAMRKQVIQLIQEKEEMRKTTLLYICFKAWQNLL